MKTREQLRKIWREYQREYRKKNRTKESIYNERRKPYFKWYYAKKTNAPKELILKYREEYLKKKKLSNIETSIKLFFNNIFIFSDKKRKIYKTIEERYNTRKEKHKEYINKNREKWNKYMSNYINNKIKTDPQFKLTVNLRKRLVRALKGIIKSDTTMNLVGCSREYLINYIESQFDDEMSWSAYLENKIHIDHILPCSSFDLTKEEEQRKCFNYFNLQPLWARDNISKGAKLVCQP